MEPEETPIVVNASPVKDQAASATRDLLTILAVVPALMAVVGTRDAARIVGYISSVEFAPALGLIVLAAVSLWRQVITRRAKAKQVALAKAPRSQALVINEKAP